MGKLDHIDDPDLRRVYEVLDDEPYDALQRGEDLLAQATDKLGVLEAMREAAGQIIDDLDEHGDEHLSLYDGQSIEVFEQRVDEIEQQIDAARARGETSDVFERWTAESDVLDDDLIDELLDDKSPGQKLLEALESSHEDDVERFIHALGQVAELDAPSSRFIDALTAFVNNAILSCYHDEDLGAGCAVIRAYAELLDKAGDRISGGRFEGELVGNAVAISQLSGDAQVQDLVLDKIVPAEVDDPRAVFNLACLAAVRGDRQRLLHFTRRALALGRPKQPFHDDSDFDAFRDDEEFADLISH